MANIPTAWYFDEKIYNLEQDFLFFQHPKYVGHELMVPNPHDFYVLDREKKGKILINQGEYYSLLSNICWHHEALLLENKGTTEKIICPAHRWSYSIEGKLLNAPKFDETPCLNLSNQPLLKWLGLLFLSRNHSLPKLDKKLLALLDFTNYQFYQITEQHYSFNWKIFIEVYLDNYHIPMIHPGLRNLINVDEQSWITNKRYSAQFVALKKDLSRGGSEAYKKYQQLIIRYQNNNNIYNNIVWFTLYPATMIEKYPYMLVISTIKPLSIAACVNYVEYYFDVTVLKKCPELAEIAITAYTETAKEDNKICTLMQEGRTALYEENLNQSGPHHPTMEKGLSSFYEFLHYSLL